MTLTHKAFYTSLSQDGYPCMHIAWGYYNARGRFVVLDCPLCQDPHVYGLGVDSPGWALKKEGAGVRCYRERGRFQLKIIGTIPDTLCQIVWEAARGEIPTGGLSITDFIRSLLGEAPRGFKIDP